MTAIDTTIPRFLNRRNIVWTYTMLQTYRNICPHQTYRRYVLKKGDSGHIPYSETDAMRRGNEVHSALELRLTGGKPLPESMHAYEKFATPFEGRKVQCEPKLATTRDGKACDYFAANVWGRGRADVALIRDDKGYLLDFKTGKVREDPFELAVQAVLLRVKYPALRKIVGQYAWLQESKLGPLHDLSDVRKTWSAICSIYEQIEQDVAREEFEKRPTPLCGWCTVTDCEHWRGAK